MSGTVVILPISRAAGIIPAAFVQLSVFRCCFSRSTCSGQGALIASLAGRPGRAVGVQPGRPTAAEPQASVVWWRSHSHSQAQSARSIPSTAQMVSVIGRPIGLKRRNPGAATSTVAAATAGVKSRPPHTTARWDTTIGSRPGQMARKIGAASTSREAVPATQQCRKVRLRAVDMAVGPSMEPAARVLRRSQASHHTPSLMRGEVGRHREGSVRLILNMLLQRVRAHDAMLLSCLGSRSGLCAGACAIFRDTA